MYKGFYFESNCVTNVFQPEGSAASFMMSGDLDSLFSVGSGVRGAVQAACVKIKNLLWFIWRMFDNFTAQEVVNLFMQN